MPLPLARLIVPGLLPALFADETMWVVEPEILISRLELFLIATLIDIDSLEFIDATVPPVMTIPSSWAEDILITLAFAWPDVMRTVPPLIYSLALEEKR